MKQIIRFLFNTTLVFITILFSLNLKAQNTDSVRIAINNILAPLDKSIIPTGILAENSYPLLELSKYKGQLSADNTIDFSQWRLLYNQILSGAYVAPTGLPDITQLNIDYNTASNNNANNVVSMALINYASIKPTAITDGYIYASNGQLFDAVANEAKTANENRPPKPGPYQTNRLFIAAAANNTAKNGVLNLLFVPSLYYTNNGLTIINAEVDFGNGNGFVNASFNTPLSGVYSTIGNKQLIYKITFSDGSIAQCYNTVYVPYIPSGNSVSRYAVANVNPTTGADIPDVVLESPTNAHSGIDLFIRRSVSNAGSNTNPQFRKPLIIVEGLDLSSATTLLGNGYNYNNFLVEIADLFKTGFSTPTNTTPQAFDQYLDDVAGYDLIFVNWHNGVDDILRNALALQDVINYVNTRKLPGAQQNVIMGISMGGLVSRYCLAQMVKAGGTGVNETQTRLLITHDSPHRGANVPLALQHLLQGLRKQRVKAFLGIYNKRLDEIIPQLNDVNTALNSPAPEQQLLARVIDDNGTVAFNTFLDGAYRTMVNFDGTGFTPPYRFVATSNGSQCGVALAAPYSQLANLDADGKANFFGLFLWTKGRTFLDMHRLPEWGQTSRILDFTLKLKVNILFFNLLKISMQVQQNAPGNLLPLDGVAGGTINLGGATLSASLSNIPPANGGANWLLFGYSYNYSTPFVAATFSFVPTTSSLDVENFNNINVPYTVPFTGLNGSRAANYIAQERITLPASIGITDNVTHTDFYARTCNWLYNEMESISQVVNCQDQCPNNFGILGGIRLCTNTQQYEINGLPPNAIVAWSYTPNNGGLNITTSGNTANVTKTIHGQYVLYANVTNICNPYTTSFNIDGADTRPIVGEYTYPYYPTSNPKPFQNYTQIGFMGPGSKVKLRMYANYSNCSFISFFSNNGFPVNWVALNNEVVITYSSANQIIQGQVNYTSDCGVNNTYTFFIEVTQNSFRITNDDKMVTINPNPTSNYINLEISDEKMNNEKTITSNVGNTSMNLVDLNSNLVIKQWNFMAQLQKNYRLNIAGIKKGIYSLSIMRAGKITVKKIIIY